MPRRERRSFTPEFKARTVELIESGGPGSRGREVGPSKWSRCYETLMPVWAKEE